MFPQTNWQNKLGLPLRQTHFTKRPEAIHRFILEVSGKRMDKIAAMVDANQGTIHREIKFIPFLVVELPYCSLQELAYFRHIKKIWHDAPAYMLLNIAVPAVGGLKAQELGFNGKGVVVAVLDTGIYPHRDLTTPTSRIVAWHDILNQKTSPYDDNGHGTHVSGIIAGNGASSGGRYKGMAPGANLVGVKVLDKEGAGNTSTVIAGIEWCLNNQDNLKLRAINLSMGTAAQESFRLDPLCRATAVAWQKGLVICAAAGNEGPKTGTINSPGINPLIITVGNVDLRHNLTGSDDHLNDSSSRGPTIDNLTKPNLLAPGTNITSLWINGGYRSLTGTSMATPMVVGAVAQIIQKWPNLKPDQIKELLQKNARDIGLSPNLQGAGVLNMEGVFKMSSTSSKNNFQIKDILQNENIKQIFGYHILQILANKIGKSSEKFKQQRNQTIKQTLHELLDQKLK